MNTKSTKTMLGFVGLGLAVLSSSCSENLYRLKEVSPNAQIVSKAETDMTLLALTPFRGTHADSLRATNLLDIQETTNYQQKLPMGMDVVYINTDYAAPSLGRSPLFLEALENSTLLIDGSPATMDKFCKENLPIYLPNAQMFAQIPVKGGEYNEIQSIAYGPKDNELSTGMLFASLWAYSPPVVLKQKPYPKYDNIPPPNSTRSVLKNMAGSFNNDQQALDLKVGDNQFAMGAQTFDSPVTNSTISTNTGRCISQRCFGGANPSSDAWWWLQEGCGKNRPNIRPDNYGCHYFNEKIDFGMTYFTQATDPADRYAIVRQSCWEDEALRGGEITWQRENMWRLDGQRRDVFAKSERFSFTSNCASCYLDMSVVEGQSKTYGVTHSGGAELGIGVGVFSASVSKNISKGTNQTAKVEKQDQREFWVNTCMHKVGGGRLFGEVRAYTLSKYAAGQTEFNFRLKYVEYVAGNEQTPEKHIQYCVRSGAPADIMGTFNGHVRTSRYYWIAATWYNKNEDLIRTFKNCK